MALHKRCSYKDGTAISHTALAANQQVVLERQLLQDKRYMSLASGVWVMQDASVHCVLQQPHLRSVGRPAVSFLNRAACSGHAIKYSSKLKLAPASMAQGRWKQRLQDGTRQPSAAPLRLQVVQRKLRARRTSVPTERKRSFSSWEVCVGRNIEV
jgi:hypothetical protein